MAEINGNLLVKINNKIKGSQNGYHKIKLDISKIFFGCCSAIYFFSYLCVISGFLKEEMGLILIGIFPLFLFSIFALIYDTILSVVTEKTENVGMLKIILIITLGILYIGILLFNYGFKI